MILILVIIIAILDLKLIFKIIRIKVFFLISCNSRTTYKMKKLNTEHDISKYLITNLTFLKQIKKMIMRVIYVRTFVTLIASIAARATLVAFTPFILITRPANREPTFVTRHKQLTILFKSDLITTNSTGFWCRLAGRWPVLPHISYIYSHKKHAPHS